MHLQELTEEEAYAYLNRAYNPPKLSPNLTEQDFFTEWHKVRDRLKEVLDGLGDWNAYGQGDYYLADSATLSRGISVAITSEKMLTPNLIHQVADFLKTLDEKYEIEFGVETECGIFEVFVSASEIKTWCPTDILSKLALR